MDHSQIQKEVIRVLRECHITSFPIDCFSVVKHYGYQVMRYGSLSEKKRVACLELSEDSCIIKNVLYYNAEKPEPRIRFSIMHELGHHILHSARESDANHFASCILAPRMVIHYAECKNQSDVANLFHISLEAADYAYQDYRRWLRLASYRKSLLDKELYDLFWNKKCGKFVFSQTFCYDCGEPIYNQPGRHQCFSCARHRTKLYYDPLQDELSPESRAYNSLHP